MFKVLCFRGKLGSHGSGNEAFILLGENEPFDSIQI